MNYTRDQYAQLIHTRKKDIGDQINDIWLNKTVEDIEN